MKLYYLNKKERVIRAFFIFIRNVSFMKKVYLFLVSIFIGLSLPNCAYSESVDAYLKLGIGVQGFGYQEFNEQNVLLDREDGLLPGFTMELGKSGPSVSAALRIELFDGLVDYDGQTQSGIPLTTNTDERITTFEALRRLKVEALVAGDGVFIAGLGRRGWRRTIRATNITSSLFEVYRWKYLTVGGALTFLRRGKWSGDVDLRWLWPIDPTMSVKISGFDAVTLGLKSRSSARLAFNFRFVTNVGQEWVISPYWESWNLGRSDDERLMVGGVPTASTVHEPRNETRVGGVTVTVRL